ncbi:MAG TPA: ABC transporter substrate-binding protein [Burkholderiales bacterium]|nr:ABC transporter substrate-binding protein [Burkholderiales bacterium]
MTVQIIRSVLVLSISLTFGTGVALADKRYDPGAADTEIKIGQTMPYSGPGSTYGTIGRTEVAYFKMINEQGGINGRTINLISLDDNYAPPRTVEQIRRLVEQDGVLLTFQNLGTAHNTAVQKYLNARKVPQLFVSTGATKWGDPQHFPWTMGFLPPYQYEARHYATYILKNKPDAKIGILYQNDDFGKDYFKGFKDGLGDKAKTMIVAELTYEPTDPTIDSQIVTLQASGADVFFDVTIPKFAAQAIRKTYDTGWRPLHVLTNVSNSVGTVIQPAGPEKAVGLISSVYLKDPTDPAWKDDKAMKDFIAFMKKYYPDGSRDEIFNVYGYAAAQTLVQVLKQCGDDLTRENVMRQAANLKDLEVAGLLPGIRINTSPTDFYPIKQVQLMRFDGKTWVRFGELMGR